MCILQANSEEATQTKKAVRKNKQSTPNPIVDQNTITTRPPESKEHVQETRRLFRQFPHNPIDSLSDIIRIVRVKASLCPMSA
jgi:hypothetical protein